MFDRLPTAAVIFALLAAAIHVLFFVLESVLFRRPFAWRTFGIRTQQDAETTRDWALNQGFYNLFLAVGVFVGVLLQAVQRCRHGRRGRRHGVAGHRLDGRRGRGAAGRPSRRCCAAWPSRASRRCWPSSAC